MNGFKLIQLDDEYLIVRQYAYKKPEKVLVITTETYENGESKVVKSQEEWRRPASNELDEDIYIFTNRQLQLMQDNYKLGNCPITQKGLRRYSSAYGSGTSWFGCPAKTARELAKKGVPLPKEAFGIYTYITGEV